MDEKSAIFRDVQLLMQVAYAGFPSPADDYRERSLDLGDLVVPHPISTYYMRVAGDSMQGACIWNGDVLVVDRAITASHNKIVVARLGEDFTVKRLQIIKGSNRRFIKPENPKYQLVEVTRLSDFEVWGVVKTPWFYLSSTALGRKAGAQRTYFLLERGQKATSFDTCNE